jgi:hypothetical protein
MVTRNLTGQKFENIECRKHGWTQQRINGRSKFKLRDAIDINFNPKKLNTYIIPRTSFVVKCDALNKEGTPIEIKKHKIVSDGGDKLSILFAEYLSIKTNRDVYKLICEKLKILYKYDVWNKTSQTKDKRKRISFDLLYSLHPEIIPLEQLKKFSDKRKRIYYHNLMNFCYEHGVTEMFNNFVSSKGVHKIFNRWIQNFRRKNFYLDCQSGLYHSSDLSFYVKPIKSYWGFNRMSVFVRLKKNV